MLCWCSQRCRRPRRLPDPGVPSAPPSPVPSAPPSAPPSCWPLVAPPSAGPSTDAPAVSAAVGLARGACCAAVCWAFTHVILRFCVSDPATVLPPGSVGATNPVPARCRSLHTRFRNFPRPRARAPCRGRCRPRRTGRFRDQQCGGAVNGGRRRPSHTVDLVDARGRTGVGAARGGTDGTRRPGAAGAARHARTGGAELGGLLHTLALRRRGDLAGARSWG